MEKKLVIFDGNALVHRGYHALPPLKTETGELVNGVYGFFLIFLKSLKELKPDYVVATFDLPGKTFRHRKYEKYKAQRPKTPKELGLQIEKVKDLLRDFGIPVLQKKGFEADDVIATIVAKIKSQKAKIKDLEVIIVSGDLDTLQLVQEKVSVYTSRRGLKDTVIYDPEAIKERYGLEPSQLLDYKALKGDPSDNIPGIKGIGKKRATRLLKKFGSLEKIYENVGRGEISKRIRKLLKEGKQQAFFSKELAKIRTDVPIDFDLEQAQWKGFDQQKIIERFQELGFETLIGRVRSLFSELGSEQLEEEKRKGGILDKIERLYQQDLFSERIYKLEKRLVPVVERMEKNGILIDQRALEQLSQKLEQKIDNLQQRIFDLAGMEFNLNSPQQLSEVLFEKIGLPSEQIGKTQQGMISTAWPELKKIREEHPIIDLIGDYRELFKLKSGFLEVWPEQVESDGRIHPDFDQLGTATGRFSCSEPNLQNVPIKGDLGRAIRKCFVVPESFRLVSFDYSQMELRIAAALSGDQKMIEFFSQGKDIHRMTATQIFKVSEQQVSSSQRKLAKQLNFGILYGMGASSLAQTAKISRKKAQQFIENYFQKFEGIKSFLEQSVKEVKEKGFAVTLWGRKRPLPEINSTDRRLRAAAERMAKNFPVQGTAADLIKAAMVEIGQKFDLESESSILLQIHDELLFEIKKEKVGDWAPQIKDLMEGVEEFKIPLRVDIKIGPNWGELEEL